MIQKDQNKRKQQAENQQLTKKCQKKIPSSDVDQQATKRKADKNEGSNKHEVPVNKTRSRSPLYRSSNPFTFLPSLYHQQNFKTNHYPSLQHQQTIKNEPDYNDYLRFGLQVNPIPSPLQHLSKQPQYMLPPSFRPQTAHQPSQPQSMMNFPFLRMPNQSLLDATESRLNHSSSAHQLTSFNLSDHHLAPPPNQMFTSTFNQSKFPQHQNFTKEHNHNIGQSQLKRTSSTQKQSSSPTSNLFSILDEPISSHSLASQNHQNRLMHPHHMSLPPPPPLTPLHGQPFLPQLYSNHKNLLGSFPLPSHGGLFNPNSTISSNGINSTNSTNPSKSLLFNHISQASS
jgi:hypothetical protein